MESSRLRFQISLDLATLPRYTFHIVKIATIPFLLLSLTLIPDTTHAQVTKTKTVKKTFTYKTIGDLKIQLDVHRVDDDKIRPAAVSIHGGALILGSKLGIGRVAKLLLDEGYCVISIDYRLAPETKLPEIIADIEDAFRWIHKNGKNKLHADTSNLIVTGGSAGGYLTLTSGFRIKPRPAILIPLWGYGDLVGPWMTIPSQHPRHQSKNLSPRQLEALKNGPPVAFSTKESLPLRGGFYQKTRRTATWPIEVSGFDPKSHPEKFYPYMAVKNVDKDYPPTLMIHGTIDTDVPFEQSVLMAEQFKKYGIPHKLIRIQNGEHGLQGADPEEINAAYEQVLPFIKKHIKN